MIAPAQIIRGQVMHERLRPANNRFVYPVFCLRVNLAKLDEIKVTGFGMNRLRPVSIYTADYGPKDGSNLEQWMRDLLAQHHIDADGEIWLHTFPRVLGFVFNPVSFWYCYDRQGGLRAVLAEVNNTFGETHQYLITSHDQQCIDGNTQLKCIKMMHVSPFCQVQGHYQFTFRDTAQTAWVGIDYFDDDGLLIKTSVGGKRLTLNQTSLWQALLAQPLLTISVFARIHWQAFLLWRKRVPFFSKPAAPTTQLSTSTPPTALKTLTQNQELAS
ncbi:MULTISPECIES: DUF1365 domain-containing protein [Deefgea]|uniref:DUF1365 family protein n=1 Tax=Deefgea chitinilytica TaxID=570276 RepID=A0ABS2CA92_9NEIS|nr:MULTISPECIES: DUF1365 domain-containing protein [Deefgea]MBM5571063.1 DUF1365 family protein [Deefgea chitinilytica]MBM9888293.1 DUF1365 domain-containing protein [Deefgea sp. CFH1-16]